MPRLVLALFCLFGFAAPASAEIIGCFERLYDAAHLNAHPEQLVRGIQVQLGIWKSSKEPADDEEDGDEDIVAIFTGGRSLIPLHCLP